MGEEAGQKEHGDQENQEVTSGSDPQNARVKSATLTTIRK